MSRVRAGLMIGMLVAPFLGSGCHVEQSRAPLKPDEFVGDYVHRSGDRGAQHDPDRLTLRSGGKYILVRMPGGHRGATEEGTWTLIAAPDPFILLDHAGYDIKMRGKSVGLIISYDRDQWYEKTE